MDEWPAPDRSYKTYLMSKAIHDRLSDLAADHRIGMSDLIDYLLRIGLEEIDAGRVRLVAIEDVSKLRVLDRSRIRQRFR